MDLLIFDLDGTLIDSHLDLAHSVNAMRQYMGLAPLAHSTVFSYVGNGAPVLVRRALGDIATDENVHRGLEYFLAYYWDHLLDNTVLYPGVREALDTFRERAIPMAVLTNKPIRFSLGIIEGLGLRDHFFRVYGGNSFEQKKPDPIGITKLLEESGAPKERALMIGDSAVDVQTARNAGIRVVGMTYGFQPESLEAHPPDYLLDDMRQIIPIVLNNAS